MKMFNAAGQAVYFNQIFKNGKTQYVVKALSGQHIKGRDGQRHASRSFTELHQAEAFLARNGYKSSSHNCSSHHQHSVSDGGRLLP